MSLDLIELNKILDRTYQWIVNCDNKSLILITLIGIMVGILFATKYVENMLQIYSFIYSHPTSFNLLYLMLSLGSILLILAGIWCIIQSIIAKIEISSDKGLIEDSLIFYGTISNHDFEDYEKSITNLDEESLKKEIISQIYINSKICTKKFENYNNGLKFSIYGFSLFAISIIVGQALCKMVWGI